MNFMVRAITAAFLLAASCPASADLPITIRGGDSSEVQEQADGSVLHRRSGLRFPKSAGSMEIGKLVVYRPGDASAVYYASGKPGDTLLSFYIYPAGQSLDAEEKIVAESIEQAWTAKRIAAPIALSLPVDARVGWYDVRKDAAAGGRSVYVVVRRGDWFLKARVTTPYSSGDAGLGMVQAGLSSLPWLGSFTKEVDKPNAPLITPIRN